MQVWAPLPDLAAHIGGLPPGVDVDFWDGRGDPPGSLDRVEFFVAPYTFARRTLEPISRMTSLRVVQTLTAGVDHIRSFVPDGVTLCNARGVHDTSTAELAVTLALSSLRGIPDFVRAQDQHTWAHGSFEALADKAVLIVGYGSIGEAIEARLVPFEVEVARVARRARTDAAGRIIYGDEELPDLLPRADVVMLVLPLTEATTGMVDADFLARMKDGALLVNVGRGATVDTTALIAELHAGRLRAALDVTDPEPPPTDHPLWDAPGLLISPHVGGTTSAFLPRAYRLLGDQLRRYAAGEPLRNVVRVTG